VDRNSSLSPFIQYQV